MGAVAIINQALVHLGQRPIQALPPDQTTDVAVTAGVFWDPCLRAVLRAHPWNFAVTRKVLNPTSAAPAYGYSYAFNKPADWLRTLEVVDVCSYKSEGKQILCNEASIKLRYIRLVEDTTYFDSLFEQALAQYLAMKLAYPLTKSTSQQKDQWDMYVALLGQARGIDAQEETADEFEESSLIRARFS